MNSNDSTEKQFVLIPNENFENLHHISSLSLIMFSNPITHNLPAGTPHSFQSVFPILPPDIALTSQIPKLLVNLVV